MSSGSRRPRSTARDIERYASLFAERTKVMKSSAMRDLMALTERPDVISLAGGLPDTSTFPPDSYASLMSTVAAKSCARALQYGPTEGLALVKRCIVQVMAAEGMEIDPDELLVTTGGQQVIDLVCKTLVDPGDVVVCEAPTYPGAVPAFCAYEASVVQVTMDRDGMRVDELEATLDALERDRRRPKFIYTVPNFHNPARRHDVARAPSRAGTDRGRARVARAGGQSLRPPALRGDTAADVALARRGRVRDLRRHFLQDFVSRRAARAGPRRPHPSSRS